MAARLRALRTVRCRGRGGRGRPAAAAAPARRGRARASAPAPRAGARACGARAPSPAAARGPRRSGPRTGSTPRPASRAAYSSSHSRSAQASVRGSPGGAGGSARAPAPHAAQGAHDREALGARGRPQQRTLRAVEHGRAGARAGPARRGGRAGCARGRRRRCRRTAPPPASARPQRGQLPLHAQQRLVRPIAHHTRVHHLGRAPPAASSCARRATNVASSGVKRASTKESPYTSTRRAGAACSSGPRNPAALTRNSTGAPPRMAGGDERRARAGPQAEERGVVGREERRARAASARAARPRPAPAPARMPPSASSALPKGRRASYCPAVMRRTSRSRPR